jgi:hypothetical protein
LRAGSRETRESFYQSHLFGDFLRDHQLAAISKNKKCIGCELNADGY